MAVVKIFISHRRKDEGYAARGINDALCRRFGSENVYFDMDSIQAGLDWRVQIEGMVKECDVMLVIIGDGWLQKGESGSSRLEDAGDLVSFEISSALKREIPVIPVLVGKAIIPDEEHLPDPVKPLFYRQAVEVRASANFNAQVERLIASIEAVVPDEHGAEPPPKSDRSLLKIALWALPALLAAVIAWLIYRQVSSPGTTPAGKPDEGTGVEQPVVEPPEGEVSTPPPDTAPPVLTYAGPSLDVPLALGSVELTGTVTDDSEVTVSVNGNAVPVSGNAWRYDLDVGFGLSEIRVEATDAHGNKSEPLVYKPRLSPSRYLDSLPADTVAALWIESPSGFLEVADRSPLGGMIREAWESTSREWSAMVSQNHTRPVIGQAFTLERLLEHFDDEMLLSLGPMPKGEPGMPTFLAQARLASDSRDLGQFLDALVAETAGGTLFTGSRKFSSSAESLFVFAVEGFRLNVLLKGTDVFASLEDDLVKAAAEDVGSHRNDPRVEQLRRSLLEQRASGSNMVLLADVDRILTETSQMAPESVQPFTQLVGAHGSAADLGFGVGRDGLHVQLGLPAGRSATGFLSALQAEPFSPGELPEIPGDVGYYFTVAGDLEKGIQELMAFGDALEGRPGESRNELEQIAGPNHSLTSLMLALGHRAHLYGHPGFGERWDDRFGITVEVSNQPAIVSWLENQFAGNRAGNFAAPTTGERWEVTRNRLMYGDEGWVREVAGRLNSAQPPHRPELRDLPPRVNAVGYADALTVTKLLAPLAESGLFEPRRLGAAVLHGIWDEERYVMDLKIQWN